VAAGERVPEVAHGGDVTNDPHGRPPLKGGNRPRTHPPHTSSAESAVVFGPAARRGPGLAVRRQRRPVVSRPPWRPTHDTRRPNEQFDLAYSAGGLVRTADVAGAAEETRQGRPPTGRPLRRHPRRGRWRPPRPSGANGRRRRGPAVGRHRHAAVGPGLPGAVHLHRHHPARRRHHRHGHPGRRGQRRRPQGLSPSPARPSSRR
jgi:hypothetical protein